MGEILFESHSGYEPFVLLVGESAAWDGLLDQEPSEEQLFHISVIDSLAVTAVSCVIEGSQPSGHR